MKTPNNTRLDEWPPSWLKMEVSRLLNKPEYIMMYDREKEAKGYPVTREDMISFIIIKRPYNHSDESL